jgi:filamentous hemagglutinin
VPKRLPHADHVIISPEKLHDYILSMEHPRGVNKARVFQAVGYSDDTWWVLLADLKELVATSDAHELIPTPHGRKFEVRGTLQGPVRPVDVVTVWIVLSGERFPRFVTMYPEGY